MRWFLARSKWIDRPNHERPVIALLIDDGGIHFPSDAIEFQIAIQIFMQKLLRVGRWRLGIEPGVINLRVGYIWLPVV